ncbi:receptor-type tyrosine-protein phosphatase S-like isoform X2 [Tribolium madens]|uniref:receptor-type tyrosine-protein phosphatase S-like isoform X2 n=1 Tax=Tribolium madens TaxID=41895 RepID=UPI001CF71D10|nr:receptor-type tyrosine-protein phosphatase S-like isoform X2 [Tribolium madens]
MTVASATSFIIPFCVVFAHCQDFFIVNRYKPDEYYCITNSSSALSWVNEDTTQDIDLEGSRFIPLPLEKHYNWNVSCKSTKDQLPLGWNCETSFSDKVILDRRWEGDENLILTDIPVKLKESFVLPLSIRIEGKAHIVLCDDYNANNSNCYWISIESNANKTLIRKCWGNGPFSVKRDVKGIKTCKNLVTVDVKADYLTEKAWTQVILSKSKNKLTLEYYENNGKLKEIISYTDEDSLYNITKLNISSTSFVGRWKFHELTYFKTTKAVNDTQIGNVVKPIEGSVCISMFVKMCDSCKITLKLKNQKKKQINEETYNYGSDWREIRFNTDKIEDENVTVFVSTFSEQNQHFWAFDNIKQCHRDGFRMISLDKSAECQLLTQINTISVTKNPFGNASNNCEVDTVSKYCIPCSWFLNDECGQLKICEKHSCFCSAGYNMSQDSIGGKCDTNCNFGNYGHQCRDKCSCPSKFCSHVDGTCGSCPPKFRGRNCTIRLVRRPSINSVSHKEVVVYISNYELIREEKTDYTYVLQYREANNTLWDTELESKEFFQERLIRITGLKQETEYYVRYFAVKDKNTNFDETIPKTEFSTSCEAIQKEDLEMAIFNTSVTISKKKTDTACKFRKSLIKSNISNDYITVSDNIVTLDSLNPDTNFSLEIHPKLQLSFRTKAGIPDKVQKLRVINKSDTSVSLMWERPLQIYGRFKHYVVKYQIVKYLSCKEGNVFQKSKSKTALETSVILEDLVPNTNYSFTVYALNTQHEGHQETVFQSTYESPSFNQQDCPKLKHIEPNTRSIQITFSSINCDKIKSPISIKISAICEENWCTTKNVSDNFDYNTRKTSFKLTDSIIPFSKYHLTVKCCRNKKCFTIAKDKRFKTPTETPSGVKDFIVFSKNGSSVSIRWREPSPPTGDLDHYKISYFISNEADAISKNITKSPCKLWTGFQCYTLSNLHADKNYFIQIRAINFEPKQYGQLMERNATTKTEASKPPLGLSIDWTLENDLQLKWCHPDESNGYITHFNISISSNNKKKIVETFKVSNHKLTYTHIINQTEFLPSTHYKIKIQAFNGVNGSPANIEDTSPPAIPFLEKEPKLSITNTTINIEIPKVRNNVKDFKLFLLVQTDDTSETISHPKELQQFQTKFYRQLKKFKILYNCSNIVNPLNLDFPLKSENSYNISLLLINTNNSKSSYKLYPLYNHNPLGTPAVSTDLGLLSLLFLLLLIPLAIAIFIKRDILKQKLISFMQRNNTTNSHILEDQMPLKRLSKNPKNYTKRIKLDELENYIKESLKNGEFERQHELFPRGQTKPWDCGASPQNKTKNRYTNLLAYDHTRVVLKKTANNQSDYINANYIDGYNIPKAYIATQGPKKSTIPDFWQMVWQENVHHIVMLANVYENEKKKVEKYWPDQGEPLHCGTTTIESLSNRVYADYEHRKFKLTNGKTTREVQQYHFQSWPDHGVPLYPQTLIPFLENLQNIPLSTKSPIVVHCSAGVGRTGTIILCDICLRMAIGENHVDILATLQKLRDQRPNMVDNIEQYKLAHLVILDYLIGIRTGIPCNEINKVEELLKSGGVKKQMRYLKNTAWQDELAKSSMLENCTSFLVKEKNRFQNIIPDSRSYIFLPRYPTDDESSIYINAVTVDGFKHPNRFIVTQQPLPNTVGDFWRLVHDKDISVIISLNEIDLNYTTCHFWPTEQNKQLKPVDFLTLKHAKTLICDTYDITTVHMHAKNNTDHKVIEIVSFKNWPAINSCPDKIESFLAFWEESYAISRQSDQVIVTCFDGALASGLYVSMSFILEKIKLEQVCDVCQAVRIVRHNRKQFVEKEEQFVFLYKAAMAYVGEFELYSNFN